LEKRCRYAVPARTVTNDGKWLMFKCFTDIVVGIRNVFMIMIEGVSVLQALKRAWAYACISVCFLHSNLHR